MAECSIRTDTKQFWFAIFMNNLQNIYLNQKQCIGISGYVILYSCNMGTSGLPDIYTQSTRAAGPRAEGVYIRQTTSAHVTTVMYHLFIAWKPT